MAPYLWHMPYGLVCALVNYLIITTIKIYNCFNKEKTVTESINKFHNAIIMHFKSTKTKTNVNLRFQIGPTGYIIRLTLKVAQKIISRAFFNKIHQKINTTMMC